MFKTIFLGTTKFGEKTIWWGTAPECPLDATGLTGTTEVIWCWVNYCQVFKVFNHQLDCECQPKTSEKRLDTLFRYRFELSTAIATFKLCASHTPLVLQFLHAKAKFVSKESVKCYSDD